MHQASGSWSLAALWRHGLVPRHRTRAFAFGLPVTLTAAMLGVPAAAVPAVATPLSQVTRPVCAAQVADVNAAVASARICGGPVAIADMTTETDDAVAEANGTVQVRHHARPVRVHRDGKWVAVDTTLIAGTDGMVAPVATATAVRFSGGGTGPMVTITDGATTLSIGSPVGALPKPVLTASTATYAEVIPGVDLTLRADVGGFAEVLVVKTRQAAANPKLARLRFALSGKGLTAGADRHGNLRVTTAKGKLAFTGGAPAMWDGQAATALTRPAPGVARGRTATMATTATRNTVQVTPDTTMLSGAATVFPVYIDPGLSVNRAGYAVINSASPNTAFWNGVDDAYVGSWDGGASKYRSFFSYDLTGTALAGKFISAAQLDLTETYSASCTAAAFEVWSTAVPTASTTWNNPPTFYSQQSTATVAKGFSGSCPAGTVPMNVTPYVQTAADASYTGIAFGLKAASETDANAWKRFSNNPTLTVTYTAYPTTSAQATSPSVPCTTGASRPYINTTTPTLQARITDPEGAMVRPEFAWSTTGGTSIGGATPTPGQASGQIFGTGVSTGAFSNNGSYSWKVRGNDGIAWGPWSGPCEFTVDTTVPAVAPTVTSTAYPAGTWAGAAGTAGSFTLGANGITDAASYLYGLDTDPAVAVTAASLGGTVGISLTPAADGPHVLKVQSQDRAGNLSPVTSYAFSVGTGAVTSPSTGSQTAGKVTLSGIGKSTTTGITYQWRRGDADTWITVPSTDVTTVGGASITWPVASTGSGNYPNLVWNVAQTVNNAEPGPDPLNGPVQLRASLTGGGAGTSSNISFVLDRNKSDAAQTRLGPGTVNLLTGNYAVSATDADTVGGLSLQRTFNSRSASDLDPMFGPGWTSSVAAPDAGSYTELSVTGNLIQVGQADGTTLGFTKSAAISGGFSYSAQVGTPNTLLIYTTSTDTYTLTDADGDIVSFTRRVGDPSGLYTPTAMKSAGLSVGSSLSWEKVTIAATDVVRPTQLLSPPPPGVSCGTLVRGCQALKFTYATTTTATTGVLGDYVGRLAKVELTAWDPDLVTPAMRTLALQQYTYDSTGRLRGSWDPRLDYISGTVQHLSTGYTYNTDGTLATLTPAGEQPWTFTYTTVPADAGTGRLYKVTRSALAAGTSVQTVVYNVPISGTAAPVDMAANISRWGQTALPVDATSVYPGDIVPDGNPATGTLPSFSNDDRVTVTYMDPNGRTTNTMYPGGSVDATWYDRYGNTTQSLTAGNLAEALYASDTDTAAQEAATTRKESTLNTYSSDGDRLLETIEPEQRTVLPGWDSIRGRTRTTFAYDEGAPNGVTFNLVTTQTEALQYIVNGATVNTDKRSTSTHYDWNLRLAIDTTIDPGGLALTARTTYDNVTANVTSTTTPAGTSSGTTPATRKTTYYRAGTGSGTAACDSHPEWASQPCTISVGGQPSIGTEIPTTSFTYDIEGRPAKITESDSTAPLRTTTITYDAAGRTRDVGVSSTLGTPVATRRNVYAAATGQLTGSQTLDSAGNVADSVTRVYDTLGRLTSYTDADNNISTKTYDLLSRPATTNDGKANRSLSFNGNGEKRGLVTQIVDAQGGTFTASYNSNGSLATETRPDGLTVRRYYNENAQPTGIEYVTSPGCADAACTLYYDYTDYDTHDKARWDSSSFSNSGFNYDYAGRLTNTRQEAANGCVLRSYSFDSSTNRTGMRTYNPSVGGQCQDSTAATTRSWSYDTADRNIDSGYGHDALGKVTTVPGIDTSAGQAAGSLTNTYYANDLPRTASQGSTTTTYTLDVDSERNRAYATTTGGITTSHTNHFSDDADSPTWTTESSGYTRAIQSIGGSGAIFNSATGILSWQVVNLHGDITATRDQGASGISASYVTDEFGQAVGQAATRYGYLGDHQRSSDNAASLISMGVRLFNPATGRFLASDPIYGGNANAYDYCSADPVNCTDLGGKKALTVPMSGSTSAFIWQGNNTTCKAVTDLPGVKKCTTSVWTKGNTVGWEVLANLYKKQLHMDLQLYQSGHPYGAVSPYTCIVGPGFCARSSGPGREVSFLSTSAMKMCVRGEGWAEYFNDTNGKKVIVSDKDSKCITLSPSRNVTA